MMLFTTSNPVLPTDFIVSVTPAGLGIGKIRIMASIIGQA